MLQGKLESTSILCCYWLVSISSDSPSIGICCLPCSVSSLLTTTEAVVVELPSDKDPPAMGGGMGGMDY